MAVAAEFQSQLQAKLANILSDLQAPETGGMAVGGIGNMSLVQSSGPALPFPSAVPCGGATGPLAPLGLDMYALGGPMPAPAHAPKRVLHALWLPFVLVFLLGIAVGIVVYKLVCHRKKDEFTC